VIHPDTVPVETPAVTVVAAAAAQHADQLDIAQAADRTLLIASLDGLTEGPLTVALTTLPATALPARGYAAIIPIAVSRATQRKLRTATVTHPDPAAAITPADAFDAVGA
jgi:hypothetical protein